MELKVAGPAQSDLILSLFAKSPDYFMNVEGCLPTPATVNEALNSTPKTKSESYKKEFVILHDGGEAIGTCEIHAHHPEPGIAYIGLLQIAGGACGRGIGRRAYEEVERYIRRQHGCSRIRIGVSDDNDVSGFWSKLGFQANGHSYEWLGERKANKVVEYEKAT